MLPFLDGLLSQTRDGVQICGGRIKGLPFE